jgi:hypothetical protein
MSDRGLKPDEAHEMDRQSHIEDLRLRVGDTVRLKSGGPGPNTGTVTQVTKYKVRVLFPIRHSMWVSKAMVEKVEP